jgi:hypothetical protein
MIGIEIPNSVNITLDFFLNALLKINLANDMQTSCLNSIDLIIFFDFTVQNLPYEHLRV